MENVGSKFDCFNDDHYIHVICESSSSEGHSTTSTTSSSTSSMITCAPSVEEIYTVRV